MKKLLFHFLHKIPSAGLFGIYLRKINRRHRGVIITLHRTIKDSVKHAGLNSFIEISAGKLEEVIKNLKNLNAKFISLSNLELYCNDDVQRQPFVHLSFDDGYEDNYTVAFPILRKYNICFSIFLTSDFINNATPFLWWYVLEDIIQNKIPLVFEKYNFEISISDYAAFSGKALFHKCRKLLLENIDRDFEYFKTVLCGSVKKNNCTPAMLKWKQINEMINSGLCEIGVHTKTHARFANITDEEKIAEIQLCKNEIRKHTGVEAKYFAFPYGSKEDIGSVGSLDNIFKSCDIELAFTTWSAEFNKSSHKNLLPREFINDKATMYTLKSRLSGMYQRNNLFV